MTQSTTAASRSERSSCRAAALVGVGAMAAVDEIVFHQILAWHHFYDHSTPAMGLLSDGFLHAFELVALIAGFSWLLRLRKERALETPWAWAGLFLGMGGFQLFDGIVDHKVLRLHQIRYGVPLLPYDLTWNLFALVLIMLGLALLARARRSVVETTARA